MPKGIKYTEEYKKEAVKLVEGTDKPVKQIAEELGIKYKTLRYWVRASMLSTTATNTKARTANFVANNYQELLIENQQLRRDLRRVEQEREILKKATAYFASLGK